MRIGLILVPAMEGGGCWDPRDVLLTMEEDASGRVQDLVAGVTNTMMCCTMLTSTILRV